MTASIPLTRPVRAAFLTGRILGAIVLFSQFAIASRSEHYGLTGILVTFIVGLACFPVSLFLLGFAVYKKILKERGVLSGIILSAAGAMVCAWWLVPILKPR